MLVVIVSILVLISGLLWFLAREAKPEKIQYGMSFNTIYARELGLNWRETYDAILTELNVRHLRLAAHWTLVEPTKDDYNFSELDYQVSQAEVAGIDIIMGVGRRLPRWPECHVPDWAKELSWAEQKQEILDYIKMVVERYRSSPAIIYWQVENEPYLEVFAKEHCGDLDETFLLKEIAFVKELDDSRTILLTDSGNLGLWTGAYRHGDVFGTSVYVYFWNPELGQFKTVLPAWFYRAKANLMALLHGQKETLLIELSVEPWLLEPIAATPLEVQYSRMDVAKFDEIIAYARDTRLERQYLWGAEWWYYLKIMGQPIMWQKGQEIFR